MNDTPLVAYIFYALLSISPFTAAEKSVNTVVDYSFVFKFGLHFFYLYTVKAHLLVGLIFFCL